MLYDLCFDFTFQSLPEVPRIWKPAVSCLACCYANDFDFIFCQKCGHKRVYAATSFCPVPIDIDTDRIEQRLSSLMKFKKDKPYQRQKSSLQHQLESFLWALPQRKSLAIASPKDVISFLIWRDKFGKLVTHSDQCLSASTEGMTCVCPKSLAAGTIDNNVGKLRTIFKEIGRGSVWNDELNIGNPAAHPSVREYHLLVLEEQTVARRLPSQAVPIFINKLATICQDLRSRVSNPHISPSNRYILARDLAFFSIDFFSGDRGSDLGRVKSTDVLCFPDNTGFIIKQVFGKTLRGTGSNIFGLKQIPGSPACPVANLRCYIALTAAMSIELKTGYLFRTTNRQGNISDSPFIGSAAANRLKRYLKELNIAEGETMHSFRRGCSITLAALGISYEDIARHVGWRSVGTAAYYCQYESITGKDSTSDLLATRMATMNNHTEQYERYGAKNLSAGKELTPLFT